MPTTMLARDNDVRTAIRAEIRCERREEYEVYYGEMCREDPESCASDKPRKPVKWSRSRLRRLQENARRWSKQARRDEDFEVQARARTPSRRVRKTRARSHRHPAPRRAAGSRRVTVPTTTSESPVPEPDPGDRPSLRSPLAPESVR